MNGFCDDCGLDMWEYSAAGKEEGRCVHCAPECYVSGVHVDAREAPQ